MICSHLHGSSFEDYFTDAQKDRYNSMCSIEAYEKFHRTCVESASIVDVIPLPDGSITYELLSLGQVLNFIDSWLQLFENNYLSKQ